MLSHTLFSLYDSRKGFGAVASQYPTLLKGGWAPFGNNDLMVFSKDRRPVKIRIGPDE